VVYDALQAENARLRQALHQIELERAIKYAAKYAARASLGEKE
jgi:hypothetical protein